MGDDIQVVFRRTLSQPGLELWSERYFMNIPMGKFCTKHNITVDSRSSFIGPSVKLGVGAVIYFLALTFFYLSSLKHR